LCFIGAIAKLSLTLKGGKASFFVLLSPSSRFYGNAHFTVSVQCKELLDCYQVAFR